MQGQLATIGSERIGFKDDTDTMCEQLPNGHFHSVLHQEKLNSGNISSIKFTLLESEFLIFWYF